MTCINSIEDLLYGWVRRHAPLVSRDALDELIDGVVDRIYDHRDSDYPLSEPARLYWVDSSEVLRGWASLD